MLPLYLAGAALLGVGAYMFTTKKKMPPAVAQAAVVTPAPAPAPTASTVVTPASPEAQAASAAALAASKQATDLVAAQLAAQQAAQIAAVEFPGTGINPGIQSATQFNPAPGPELVASSPEVVAAAQAASNAAMLGGVFASPAQQLQTASDLLNQFTNPNE